MSFFLCARVLVLIDCLSPLWSEMMRSIVSHSPWRYKFLFSRRIPMFCKNTDQNLQRVVKACMCGSCCDCFMLPLQECVSKQQQLYCRTQNFDCSTLHLEAEVGRVLDWKFGSCRLLHYYTSFTKQARPHTTFLLAWITHAGCYMFLTRKSFTFHSVYVSTSLIGFSLNEVGLWIFLTGVDQCEVT